MYAIEVSNLAKRYHIHSDKRRTLKETMLFWNRNRPRDLWVLQDVNINIEPGKTVGLIGANGSGKSTLLKILANIIAPTRGRVVTRGRVSSLIELGAGFDPDFSGRENIYMNASIFGLTRREIDEKFDSIVDFSELADFIDSPVRTYSSGMYMRLGFAVAIHVQPEILLIDEVLAVGDTAFQKKCMNKILELKAQKKTVVFVSHDLGSVEELCDEAVWLEKGRVVQIGTPRRIIDAYRGHLLTRENERRITNRGIQQGSDNRRWGNRDIEILQAYMTDHSNNERYVFECGEPASIVLKYRVNRVSNEPVFGVKLQRGDGVCCYGVNTDIDKVPFELLTEGTLTLKVQSLNLIEGTYTIDVAVHEKDGTPMDYQAQKIEFSTVSPVKDIGIARLHHKWELT